MDSHSATGSATADHVVHRGRRDLDRHASRGQPVREAREKGFEEKAEAAIRKRLVIRAMTEGTVLAMTEGTVLDVDGPVTEGTDLREGCPSRQQPVNCEDRPLSQRFGR